MAMVLAGCVSSATRTGGQETQANAASGRAHPQAVEPAVGSPEPAFSQSQNPIGDPNAHATPLAEVKKQLAEEQKIAAELNSLNSGQGFVFPIAPL